MTRIAITGGTGSLGGALIDALRVFVDVTGVVVVSRDEVKSGDLADRYADWPPLKCSLGDVRDYDRMLELFRGCDAVIHAAALKRITHSAYSPSEVICTNVLGTMNVVRAATDAGVRKVVVVSSDKATEPLNLYGVSKAAAETFAVQQNSYAYPRGTTISCVRYGNVIGSRGSVVHIWRDQLRRGQPLSITDARMTRFIITLPQAAEFVLRALREMRGGEVFVPRLPAARMTRLADAVEREFYGADPRLLPGPRETVGLRPGGEKLHEALISREEPARSWVSGDASTIVVLPTHHSWVERIEPPSLVRMTTPYTSDEPASWLSTDDLVGMIREVPR